MPLATVAGCPVGLSLIGSRNSDMALLAFAESFTDKAGNGDSDPWIFKTGF
jgi:Asp-tRNA(Asn)/Glu-tRNA(Gln) amidotransferase A subunit family amidase